MAIQHITIDPIALATTAVTVYTVGTSMVAKSVAISVFNGNASTTRTITVHKVPSGGSADSTNIITKKVILSTDGSDSVIIDEVSVQTMDAGDFIAISQDVGTDCIASGGATEVSV